MSELLAQVLLAFVSVAGAFTTALFTWLRHRDTQRMQLMEVQITEHKDQLDKCKKTAETLQGMVFKSEFEKSGLQAKLEVLSQERVELSKELKRLRSMLDQETCEEESKDGTGSGSFGESPVS